MPERPSLHPLPESSGLADPGWPAAGARAPTPLLLVVVSGLVATLVMVFLVSRLEDHAARTELAALADQRFTLLDASLGRAVDSVVAVGSDFQATGEVSRQQFARLAMPILRRQPALKALAWVPYTPADRLDALRAKVRAEGHPGFEIEELGAGGTRQPVGARAEYFPIEYIEPMAANVQAFGFDLGSNPQSLQALDTARRQGRLTASARIALVQDLEAHPAIQVVEPIYRGSGDAGEESETAGVTLTPDPAALRGYVLGVFRLDQLIDADERRAPRAPLDIHVFDLQGTPGERLLFPAVDHAESVADVPGSVRHLHELVVGGRTWQVLAQPAGGALHVDHTGSAIVAVAGMLLTVLLGLLQEQNRDRTAAIERSVARRTADLRESERRLIQANHEAVQANRLKTMYLASMSHEFRTPMNAILGLLHVLGRTPLNPTQGEHVEKIVGAARRLLRLIDDILDVSRIEAGKLSVEREPFRIETAVRDMVVAVAPKLRDKPVELVLDIDPTLPAVLIGDGMRLTQVLVNLADNAAKFTQEGQIELQLAWIAEKEQRLRLRVELRDSGAGMSGRELDAVFLPFVQTATAHRRKHGGTGLGLAICRQLVNLMGGEIHVESQPGLGSSFWFEIPLGIAAPAPLVVPPAGGPAPAVLLVERHARAARAVCRIIEAFGAVVRAAPDEHAALELMRDAHYTLLLAPQGGGIDRLLEEFPPAQRPGRVVHLLATGASLRGGHDPGLLEKPLLPGQVAAVLFPAAAEGKAPPPPPPPHAAATVPGQRGALAARGADAGAPALLELDALAATLRAQLERGDPEAELSARALALRCQATPFSRAAQELQQLCSNLDFREALVALDELCPPRSAAGL